MNHREINSLLEKAQSGDKNAIEKFILHYNPVINKYVNHCLTNYDLSIVDKDDLIQEARLALYNNIPNFNFSNVPLIIYRAMTKYIKNYDNFIDIPEYIYDSEELRHQELIENSKVSYLDEDTVKLYYEEPLIEKLDKQRFFNQLFNKGKTNLKPIYINILYLKYYKDYTNVKIAEIFGLSHERVRQLLNEALRDIRRMLNIKYNASNFPVRYRYNKKADNQDKNELDLDFNILYMDINLHYPALVNLLENWYNRIFMECFKFPNEIEFLDNIKDYLSKAETSKDYEYHVIIMIDNMNTIIGGCIYDYFYKSNIGVIEYLAINPNLQNRGYGTKLYRHIREQIEEKAYKIYEEKHKYDISLQYQLPYIFCEIEDPNKVKDIPQNYLYFWNKLGFQYIDMNYVQPALSESQRIVGTLKLIVNRMNWTYIDLKTIDTFLYNYMKYSMNIDDPYSNRYYQFMITNIQNNMQNNYNFINLNSIIKEN